MKYLKGAASDLLRRALTRLGNHGPSRNHWLDRLRSVGAELEVLNRQTEEEFLATGEQLQSIYVRAREISELSSSVARLISGERVAQAIEGFSQVAGLVNRLELESTEGAAALKQVLERLAELRSHLAGFAGIARTLRTLCVSTRIESARLGERDIGFSSLAQDVNKLALEIDSKCATLIERSALLMQLIGERLSSVLQIESAQHDRAALMIQGTMSSLRALTERHQRAAKGAEAISARYAEISTSVGEMVSSMQFHDITRQRLEHVKEAFDQLEEDDGSLWRPFRADGARLHVAAEVSQVQTMQLRSAKDEFIGAVESILLNLGHVARNIDGIVEATRSVAGTEQEAGHGFLSDVEAGIGSVESALSRYADAGSEMSCAMDSISLMLADMSIYAGDIEGIGTKMKLIALNAIVKSCHIGEVGAALGVLAESIHALSDETCRLTATVCGTLGTLIEGAATLKDGMCKDSHSSVSDSDSVRQAHSELLVTLRELNEASASSIEALTEKGLGLSEDIRRCAGRVHVHELFETVLSRQLEVLQAIVESSKSQGGPEAESGNGEFLGTLEASYTMESERMVHRQVLGAGAAVVGLVASDTDSMPEVWETLPEAPEKENEQSGTESEDEFGDNVELF